MKTESVRAILFLLLLAAQVQWVFAAGEVPVLVPRGNNFMIGAGLPDSSGGRPSAATDGTNFLATWRNESSGNVYCARVSRDGTVLDATPILVGTGSHLPSVAFDGSNYLLVWVRGSEIVGARVSMNGTLIDATPLVITAGGDVKVRAVAIAFDGANFLVAWRTNTDIIRALRVARTGAALGSPDGFAVGAGFYPWVAAGGGQFVIAWSAHGASSLDVVRARYASDGTLLAAPVVLDLPADQDHVSVAFGGTNFLIVWHDWRNTDSFGNGQAQGVRMGMNGAILDESPILISETTLWQVPVVAAFDGTDYFVAWHANTNAKYRGTDSYGRRVSTSGSLLEEKPVPLSTAYSLQWSPSVAAAGDRIFAMWVDRRDAGPGTCGGGCVQGQILERKLVTPDITGTGGTPAMGPPQWSVEPSPTQDHLYTIAAADNANVYAAGEGPILQRVCGSWQPAFSNINRMFGLWAGPGPVASTAGWWWYQRTTGGSGWEERYGAVTPFGIAFGIWGFGHKYSNTFWGLGSDFAMMVGSEGMYQKLANNGLATFEGWEYGNTGTSVTLYDVWGSSPENIYAVGEFGTILHFDGIKWTPVSGVPTSQSLNAIWGTAPDNIFVVGDFGTVLRFDGSAWHILPTPTSAHLYGISAAESNAIYAVGARGTVLRYDGLQWSGEASGTTASLFDVAVTEGKAWIVGESGTILAKKSAGGIASDAGARWNFTAGWNLAGNSCTGSLDVASAFGDGAKVATVWKWNALAGKWALYAPSLAAQALADYASGKGYEVLTTIAGGEGFWVNAKSAFGAQVPSAGEPVSSALFKSMPSGWNLIAIGDNSGPGAFNKHIGLPTAPWEIPVNLTTLWAWDSSLANWYFYAPDLVKSGSLSTYVGMKGYLEFGTRALTPGTGFWVNRP